MLARWFGVSGWFYNQTVEHFNKGTHLASPKHMGMQLVRDAPEWTKDVLRHMKAAAVYDAYKARKMLVRVS